MNITEQAHALYNRMPKFHELGCREQSDILATLRDLQMKIDPENVGHYEAQLYLDRVAMSMCVFIGPNGEIERVGTP